METEARGLEQKYLSIRAEREANEATLERLDMQRKSVLQQRQTTEEFARAQREALAQQEYRVKQDLEYMTTTQVARLDTCKSFYSTRCRHGTVLAVFALKSKFNNDCMCMQRRCWEKLVTADYGRPS